MSELGSAVGQRNFAKNGLLLLDFDVQDNVYGRPDGRRRRLHVQCLFGRRHSPGTRFRQESRTKAKDRRGDETAPKRNEKTRKTDRKRETRRRTRDNKGYALLEKMGYVKGMGLGKDGRKKSSNSIK